MIQGETIRHAGEISREGQEIERKTGRVIHTHIHTLVRDCVVSPKRRKRTRGDHWNETGGRSACANIVYSRVIPKWKREEGGEKKERERQRERIAASSSRVRARCGCNFQELTYLTTVNMGTLHTHNAYPLFILRSRQTFSITKSVSAVRPPLVVRKGSRGARGLRCLHPPARPLAPLPPCIRFNQNATSVGRARSTRSGTSSVAPSSYRSLETLRRLPAWLQMTWLILSIRHNYTHHVNP